MCTCYVYDGRTGGVLGKSGCPMLVFRNHLFVSLVTFCALLLLLMKMPTILLNLAYKRRRTLLLFIDEFPGYIMVTLEGGLPEIASNKMRWI